MKTNNHFRFTSHNIKAVVGCLTLIFTIAASLAPRTGAQKPTDSGRASRKTALSRKLDVGVTKPRRSSLRDSLLLSDELSPDAQRPGDHPNTNRQADAKGQGAAVANETRTVSKPKPEAQASSGTRSHTIVVSSLSDDGPDSLRQALASSVDGDTINITAKGTITLTSGELIVDKSMTIRGPGAAKLIVDGNAASRVFHIMPNVTVTIADIKIMNGRATGTFPANAGGGILNDHAFLTIEHCIISGNRARFGGGVLSNSKDGGSATLTVNNSAISGNASRLGYGGGIFSGGGFLSEESSGNATLSLNNSTVSENSAGFGGGIFNDGFNGSATATVANSSVSNNSAKWPQDRDDPIFSGGGGIYNNGDSGVASLTLTDSAVSGNISGEFFTDEEFVLTPGNGGGIYNDGLGTIRPGNARVTLTNTTVNGNQARSNAEGGYGGAIINEAWDLGSAMVTVNAGTLNDNWADQYGSGIANLGVSAQATVTVIESGINGGNKQAVANFPGRSELNPDEPGRANVTLSKTVIRENSGLEAVLNLGNLEVTGCEISDNHGTGIVTGWSDTGPAFATIIDSLINRNGAENLTGGGLTNFGAYGRSTLTIINTTIRGNRANSGGGIANITNFLGWRV